MNIFLIGYRCTGKTHVGRLLAQHLSRPFVDLDAVITESAGMSIATMIERHGWDFFRDREREILETAAQTRHQVIATGGGIVENPVNIATLRRGTVIWLTATAETIGSRLSADPATSANRPPLTNLPSHDEIRRVLAERTPLYQNAAHLTIATDTISIADVCEQILSFLKGVYPCPADSEPF
ncbi:shikimate kinase [Desulfosarcina sp. OttesenSCG-928-A07]|nr:shikimate kinase [Desulfosarcina sp. OttesenSCG-928-A07]